MVGICKIYKILKGQWYLNLKERYTNSKRKKIIVKQKPTSRKWFTTKQSFSFNQKRIFAYYSKFLKRILLSFFWNKTGRLQHHQHSSKLQTISNIYHVFLLILMYEQRQSFQFTQNMHFGKGDIIQISYRRFSEKTLGI